MPTPEAPSYSQALRILSVGRKMNVPAYRKASYSVEALAGGRSRLARLVSLVRQLWRTDIFEMTTFGDNPLTDLVRVLLARLMGVKVVRQFCGTDVWNVLQSEKVRRHADRLTRLGVTNVAGADNLSDELESAGIPSRELTLPNPVLYDISLAPLPEQFTVLLYLPKQRRDFYRAQWAEQLYRDFPDVKFIVVAGDPAQPHPDNVEVHGLVSQKKMREIYARSTVLLRTPIHDGLARMMMEALAMGRRVIWSYAFPHTLQAQTLEQCRAALVQLRTEATLNTAGADYVARHYHQRHVTETVTDFYRDLLAGEDQSDQAVVLEGELAAG